MTMTRQTLQDRQISLIEHYLERLDDLSQMYVRGHDWAQEALHRFDLEWQQLQAQQQAAVSIIPRDNHAARLVVAFPEKAGTLLMQIDPQEATSWLEDALVWVQAESFESRYQLLRTSYNVRKLKLDTDRMWEMVEALTALGEQWDDEQHRAEVAYLTADYYDTISDYDNQIIWAERALEMALRLEDDLLIAEARYALGFGCIRVHQYKRAADMLRQALDFFQKSGMRLNESYLWNALALNEYYQTHADKAVLYAERALEIVREIRHRNRELIQLSNLALFTMGDGDLEKALLYARQALTAAQAAGTSEKTAATSLLYILVTLGMADELTVLVDQLRKRLDLLSSPTLTQQLHVIMDTSLAYMAYEQGDWRTACQLGEQVVCATHDTTNGEEEYEAAFIWASSLIELGRLDEAAEVFSRCLVLYTSYPENQLSRAGALSGLGYVETRRGHFDLARDLMDQFLSLLDADDIGNMNSSFVTAWHAYKALTALGHPHSALILERFDTLLQQVLSRLHDETLRASFLNQITIQRLTAVQP